MWILKAGGGVSTQSTEHTPTPYKSILSIDNQRTKTGHYFFVSESPRQFGPEHVYLDNSEKGKANAAFIVTACNAHDELVATLEDMVAETCDYMYINNLGDPEKQHNIIRARAILAKAKGTA